MLLLLLPLLKSPSHGVFHCVVFLLSLGILNIHQNKHMSNPSRTIKPLRTVWHVFPSPFPHGKIFQFSNSIFFSNMLFFLSFLQLQIQKSHVLVDFFPDIAS